MEKFKPVPVIGLYSPYVQAGKSTLAEALIYERGFTRIKMADGLKAMLRALLAYQGLDDEGITRRIEGSSKGEASPWLSGHTPRYAMQTLGTQWARDCMGEDFWVEVASSKIHTSIAAGVPVVIDDIRFENEYYMVQMFSAGLMVKVTRPDVDPQANMPWWRKVFAKKPRSEGNLNKMGFDLTFVNEFSDAKAFTKNALDKIDSYLWDCGYKPR
jgi:hypothetical protein